GPGGPLEGTTIEVSDPWRWGRRPRHGTTVRGAMLCEPVADASQPFAPLDVRGFFQHMVGILLGPDPLFIKGQPFVGEFNEWMSPRSMAARVLGSVPLREYLEPDQVAMILAKGA